MTINLLFSTIARTTFISLVADGVTLKQLNITVAHSTRNALSHYDLLGVGGDFINSYNDDLGLSDALCGCSRD